MNAHREHCAQHSRHVGFCPACQRASIAAQREQLADAIATANALAAVTRDPQYRTVRVENFIRNNSACHLVYTSDRLNLNTR